MSDVAIAEAEKARLRHEVRARVTALDASARRAESAALCEALAAAACWGGARTVAGYFARPEEPDLAPLLARGVAEGRRLALPRWNGAEDRYELVLVRNPAADCAPGRFGILEPRPELPALDARLLDLALVPGVAFDLGGRRLGRGGGFYDRLLAGLAGGLCGVCFAEQVVPEVPSLPHDVRMTYLATPAGVRPAGMRG
ncbi:MAG: 5-formyltetrahydrofolate cyclo-ligase [Limisphaerales bacterium]